MTDVSTMSLAIADMKAAGASLTNSDWSSIYKLMDRLSGNAEEIKKFSVDPVKYSSDAGIPIPNGVGIISYREPQGLGYTNPEAETPTTHGVRVMAEVVSSAGIALVCIICGGCKSMEI